MIVLSFVLVIVAAVTLVIGLFQTDSLEWIWASIGSCVAAMVFLGIGVLQRRGAARPPVEAEEAYRAAPLTGLSPSPGSTMTQSEPAGVTPEEITVVTGRTSREPSQRILEAEGILEAEPAREVGTEPPLVPKRTAETGANRTGAEPAAEMRIAEMPVASTPDSAASIEGATAAPSPSTAESPSPSVTKKTAARAVEATKKAASKQTTMAPAARREATQRATAKKTTARASGQSVRPQAVKSSKRAARQTTGEAARAELAKIKGLGPAKQEALLREFGSVEAIRAATVEQLTSIRGIGETTAREILTQSRR